VGGLRRTVGHARSGTGAGGGRIGPTTGKNEQFTPRFGERLLESGRLPFPSVTGPGGPARMHFQPGGVSSRGPARPVSPSSASLAMHRTGP
jgi:hypothetical protein